MAAEGLHTVDIVARVLNLTPRRVQQLANEGIIPRPERGGYKLLPSCMGYIKYLQEKIEKRESEKPSAREEREIWQARREKLRFEKESGELVNAADMRMAYARAFSVVQSRLLAIPSAHAEEISGITDRARIFSILQESIKAALSELAGNVLEESVDDGENETMVSESSEDHKRGGDPPQTSAGNADQSMGGGGARPKSRKQRRGRKMEK